MALDKKRIYEEDQDPFYVNADKPASEQDLIQESPDDKQLEQNMANEDFVAGESSDKHPREMSDEELLSHLNNQLQNPIPDQSNIKQTSTQPRNLEGMTLNKDEAAPPQVDQKQEDQTPFKKMLSSIDESKAQEANRLADAQAERRQNIAGQSIERGAALFGAGMAKTSPDEVMDIINKKEQYTGLPVKEYEEQVANQQNDPRSPMSQVLRDYLKNEGFETRDDYSAADILKVAPFLMNDKKLEQAMKRALLQSQTKKEVTTQTEQGKSQRVGEIIKSKEQIAKERAEAQAAAQKAANEYKEKNLKLRQDYLDTRKEQGGQRIGLSATKAIEGDDIVKKANQRLASAQTALDQLQDKSQPLTYNRLNAIQIDLAQTLSFMGANGASDFKAKSDKLENLKTKVAELQTKYGTNLQDLRTKAPEVYNEIIKYTKSVQDSVDKIRKSRYDYLSKQISKGIGSGTETGQRIQKNYTEPVKTPASAAGMHNPGDIVEYPKGSGKQYKVGQDGDSLEPIQ